MIYLGNIEIGNGNYLGNQWLPDGNIFMSQSAADTTLKVWLDAGNATSYPGSGTTWYDLSGNSNNLFLSGSPTYDATTGSFYFPNSTSVYAVNQTPTNLSIGTNSCTTEIWMRYKGPTDDSNYYPFFELGQMIDTGGAPYNQGGILGNFTNFNNQGLQHQVGGQSLSYNIPTYPTSNTWGKLSANNVWVQAVFVKTGTTGEVFVNGSSIGTNSALEANLTTTNKIFVGSNNPANPFGGQFPFYGDIAIFKVWNGKALTSTEITNSWNATKARFGY